ncbi:hypothetical protein ACMBCM_08415 [Spiroplasma sp. K1]
MKNNFSNKKLLLLLLLLLILLQWNNINHNQLYLNYSFYSLFKY